MSMLVDFEPARLHKRTWAERHDLEILVIIGIVMFLSLLMVSFLLAEPTVAGVV